MKKIAVICPYYGEFPNYIEITINSMKNNNFIDWYIVSDIDTNFSEKYSNIKFIKMTLDELKKLILKKIGTSLSAPYKLCDYKVTYGLLFEDYLKEYDYWGYYDLDVIYGDLYGFLKDKLYVYDKIYDLGHFSILKNEKNIVNLFKKNPNYKEILNSKKIYQFDETYDFYDMPLRGINGLILDENFKIYTNRLDYMDLDVKYNNFFPEHLDKKKYYYFLYKNNRLFMKITRDQGFNNEIAYIHLQKKKNIPIYIQFFNEFAIMPRGFIEINKISKKYYYKLNFKLIWYLKFRIHRKVEKLLK